MRYRISHLQSKKPTEVVLHHDGYFFLGITSDGLQIEGYAKERSACIANARKHLLWLKELEALK